MVDLQCQLIEKLNNLDKNTKIRLYYRLRLIDLNNSLSEVLMALIHTNSNPQPNTINLNETINEIVNDGSINFYRKYILHNLYDDTSTDSCRYKNLVSQTTHSHRAYDYFNAYTLKAYNVYYAKLLSLLQSSYPPAEQICYFSDLAKNYTLYEYKHLKFHQFDFGVDELLKIPKEINPTNRYAVVSYLKECLLAESDTSKSKSKIHTKGI